MSWLRQNCALLGLAFVMIVIALLLGTGTLQLEWSGRQAGKEDSGEALGNQPRRVSGDTVTVDPATLEVSKIKTIPVSTASFPAVFQTVGEVELSPDRMAHVTPKLAGIIRSIGKNVGDPVVKGETLGVIESAELGDARASYLAALSERDYAQRNYERWKLLFEKGLRTQNELYAAEADFTHSKIKLEAAQSRLRALGFGDEDLAEVQKKGSEAVSNRYGLRSPISGTVLERNLTLGQNIDTKDQLFLIGDLSVVWVQAVAHEGDLSQLHAGLPAIVRLQVVPRASFSGTITYLGQQVDEKTRTIPVRIVVKNTGNRSNPSLVLRPGLFTTIEVKLSTKREVPAIPESAVQTEADRSYVFVELEAPASGKTQNSRTYSFQRRPVVLGVRASGRVEVVGGLVLGERVVTENAFLLTAEMQKSNVEE